jgi:hypothetical protein
MSNINAFSRVLNQQAKTRCFFIFFGGGDFQLMDNLNMTACGNRNGYHNTELIT